MAELTITVKCESMLISTGFFRFCKAVEHFYYVLLFTSEPYVDAGAQPWRSWFEVGFHLAARAAPPAAGDADRLHVEVRPEEPSKSRLRAPTSKPWRSCAS